jgi:hypothetical protein
VLLAVPQKGPFSVQVTWPDGQQAMYDSLQPNQYWIIRPGLDPRSWSEE